MGQPAIPAGVEPTDTASEEVARLLARLAEVDPACADPRCVDERRTLVAEVVDRLLAWRAEGGVVRLEGPPRPGEAEVPARLRALLAEMVPATDDALELERLHRAARGVDRWTALPRDVQRALLSLVVTRLRRLQDDVRLTAPRLEDAFSLLTAWSKREQPGFVIGLSRAHRPVRGTWAEDAETWWERLGLLADAPVIDDARRAELLAEVEAAALACDAAPPEQAEAARRALRGATHRALDGGVSARDRALVRLCLPRAAVFEHDGALGALRRSLRDAAEPSAEAPVPLPEEWRWWSRVRGRRGAVVIAEGEAVDRAGVAVAFALEALDPYADDAEALGRLRQRLAERAHDLVLVAADLPVAALRELVGECRQHRVDWALVEPAPGVGRVRRAIERYVDPAPRR